MVVPCDTEHEGVATVAVDAQVNESAAPCAETWPIVNFSTV